MSLQDDLEGVNNYAGFNKGNIGLAYFDKLRAKPFFCNYAASTLYRAYIMEYLILLWDNTYYLLINRNSKRPKLHGVTNEILGAKFLKSGGYKRLVELQYFLENNYFSRYALNRYLTQAWTNYLFNKQISYRFIPLNRIYASKVKKQYLELSEGLADETVYMDNLSFTNDPVTIALLNYYYYLDRDNYKNLISAFESTLSSNFNIDMLKKYYAIKDTRDMALILYFIFTVGNQYEPYTVSYGDNLLLKQDIKVFLDSNQQQEANISLVEDCDTATTITLALSRKGTFKEILHVICKKQLGCNPITQKQISQLKSMGYRINDINDIRVSISNYDKDTECS